MSEPPVAPAGRRHFLRVLALAAAGSATTACATRTTAGAGAASVGLDDFLALSALLTGVKSLNAEHGRLYLASLTPAAAREVAAVTERAGLHGAAPPATLEAVVRTGALQTAAARRVTATIVECWYTGVYASPTGPRVATYLEALAWSRLGFTKPPGVCGGGMGHWADAPPANA